MGGIASARQADPTVRLLWEVDSVLALVPQLRATSFVANLAQLRERIAAMLGEFQTRARADGIDAQRIAHATDVLSALIDHVVTSMPWGADAGWHSLGTSSAASDGRSPAQRLLDATRADPSDVGIGELVAVALALGFDERGLRAEAPQIDQLRASLATPETQHNAQLGQCLSPEWQSSVAGGKPLMSWLPLWVSSMVIAAVLAVLFFSLELSLGSKSDRLYARIAALNGPAATARQPLPAPKPRLTGILSAQIASRQMAVRDEIDRSVIVVPAGQLFEPGNATLLPASIDLLHPIAAGLQLTPGRVQVIGHTDGSFTQSARYPSEWELSVDRARAVQEGLRGAGIEGSRLTYDGRASVEPLLEDDPARPVSGNDRVEIVLLAGR